ncbi:hypothetical protein F5884DRAFT_722587 [Xylogone sp. PMI_703]|nr:hypothetical protein F5884DRAFT_722587 [Xylogone sp. PMI_703]
MAGSVLITGANRGIGKGLVKQYLSGPNTTVIATVRDVTHPSAAELQSFTVGSGSRLIVVKIDSTSSTDAEKAVEELRTKYGITRVDTVIANAGLGIHWDPIKEATPAQAEENFTINAVGPMRLFYATYPLLSAAETPRFVVISSVFGSIAMQDQLQLPNIVYGMSKAAANFFARKVHHEYSNLIAFPLHPGWVQTDLGNGTATKFGFGTAPTTVEESVTGIIEQINKSTREETSGRFIGYDGKPVPW